MADELRITLLGTPHLSIAAARPALARRKSLALLAYLAVTGRPHSREALIGLLWPDATEANARASLRKSLADLRRFLAPYLVITHHDVTLDPAAPWWLDVTSFQTGIAQTGAGAGQEIERLKAAVDLYRGDFLEGFYVRSAQGFEEWALAQRARLRELALQALNTLAAHYADQGEAGLAPGIDSVTRLLALEPWREEAHRQLMRLLALSGQRGAALAQYEVCRQVLADELGVEPGPETMRLYEQIRDGELRAGEWRLAPRRHKPASLPATLTGDAVVEIERPLFVARQRELERLDAYLDAALNGRGQVVFITGGPGRGKTALLRAFARRAMDARADLLSANGACNAYSGVGDPYLPFRELLGALTGDVTAALSREHAQRLWAVTPWAAQTLLDHGLYLIDALVPGPPLLQRATAAAGSGAEWLQRLHTWVARERPTASDLEQSALLAQVANTLRALAVRHPLLLMLDDLQWADAGSVSLLFHLGRSLAAVGGRVLILGAYRPEEVTREGAEPGHRAEPVEARHPLAQVLAEFRRLFGDVSIDLAQIDEAEGRRFVDALVGSAPNRLGADFREALYRRTGGHPLFTVELLRGMRERGDLVQADGVWVARKSLDWSLLPAQVEAVIASRVDRLPARLRDILAVASVEGERFTAQVVAHVQQIPERQVLRALHHDLGAHQRLVHPGGEEQVRRGGAFLSRFSFAHALYQEYVYNKLGEGERRLLHREVGAALEGLYGDDSEEIAAALAYHYDAAGHRRKALEYALRAGDQALRAYANEEAHTYYQRALELLAASPPGPGPQTQSEKVWRLRALRGLGHVYLRSSQSPEAEACFREAIALGQETGLNARELVQLHWWVGFTLFQLDRHADRIPLGEQGLALLGADTESAEAVLMYINLALGYGFSGNWEKRREYAYRAASILPHVRYAEALAVPYLAIVATYRDNKRIEEALAWAETFMEWAQAHQDLRDIAIANRARGDILVRTGDLKRGLARYERELALYARIGKAEGHYWSPCRISDVLFALGDLSNAHAYALECRDATDALGSARFSANNHMQRGRIHLSRGAGGRAAAAFRSALRCRRRLDHKGGKAWGKAWAAYALGRLCLGQGDPRRASRWLQAALALVIPDLVSGLGGFRPEFILWASLLNGIEEACDDAQAFRDICRCWREKYPELSASPFVQWYLEPANTGMPGAPSLRGEWDELSEGWTATGGDPPHAWTWHGPLGDCTYGVQDGLVIHAANGRDLWHINLSAPRLLRPAPDVDFGVQTVCAPATDDRPGIGGLLLWHDKENYLRLDRGTRGNREISFQGCLANQDVIIGRGRLELDGSERVLLRLERTDDRVRALCSADGESWFSVGHVGFPVEGPLQVGLHAIGLIDRTVYPGAYPDGTAIRFESFTLWKREEGGLA
jgi:DNA-binding SARP family transcriptional activator/tetratricopeptide (TPR) repeat protein